MNNQKSPLAPEFAALLPPPEPGPDCIVIGLSFAQVNALMAALCAAPYAQVAELVDVIRLQVEGQWNQQAQAQALAEAPAASDVAN